MKKPKKCRKYLYFAEGRPLDAPTRIDAVEAYTRHKTIQHSRMTKIGDYGYVLCDIIPVPVPRRKRKSK